MKASDYIVEYLALCGIHHFFGYQGTMIAHFIDSIGKNPKVENHTCYNEQGAAFAAVGYAKASGKCALAYATSGPGAINLMSGIADAYYDSAPVIFLTGQLNTNEYTEIRELRQQGFQETNVISMAASITKYCKQITDVDEIPGELAHAYALAMEGRRGPVLLDIPMNMQRLELDADPLWDWEQQHKKTEESMTGKEDVLSSVFPIVKEFMSSKRPVLLLGNGISKEEKHRQSMRNFIEKLGVPVVTSMLGRDILSADHPLNFGMIGSAYGHRYTNLIVCQKADYILSIGCSMCPRQTGMKPENFAPNAKITRVDIDTVQLRRKIHGDEQAIQMDAMEFISAFLHILNFNCDFSRREEPADRKNIPEKKSAHTKNIQKEIFSDVQKAEVWSHWLQICDICKKKLQEYDKKLPEMKENRFVEKLSHCVDADRIICSDVGQHQVWTATSFQLKEGQRFLCSGGHGAMGFSIPAAIGAYYATGRPVTVLCGDGSAQMNIQELQWIKREQIPVTIMILNNGILGLIRQQQDSIFEGRYVGAAVEGGYESPDFEKIAKAYGIDAQTVVLKEMQTNPVEQSEKKESSSVKCMEEKISWADILERKSSKKPFLVQILMRDNTVALPKTIFGEPMYNQKPYIPSDLMEELLNL